MTQRQLHIYGNHRGGLSLVHQMPAGFDSKFDKHWTLADPKDDRADRMAEVVRGRFAPVVPNARPVTARQAIADSDGDAAITLALDSVAATAGILPLIRSRQTLSFQIVGRGPGGQGGVRAGFQGTVINGDTQTLEDASLLLNGLARMTSDSSSRRLTVPDPLSASALRPMRETVSRQTVRHLESLGSLPSPRELPKGSLTAVFGWRVYPLVCVPVTAADGHRHRRDSALEASGRIPGHHMEDQGWLGLVGIVAVVVDATGVEFVRVVRDREGRRRVDGVTEFRPPLPVPQWITNARTRNDSALFTD